MPAYPKPRPSDLKAAFNDHKVNWVAHSKVSLGRSVWSSGLRAATVHHTGGVNSADYLATHWSLPGANCVINNGTYNGAKIDGRAVILSWGDCWHSGAGGPWKGVAGRDSLHLVSWGIEVESKGTRPDMTDKQVETVGRMLAALVDLGMPIKHIHRHEDWTDGTGPVGGYPLPTNGRKIDTNRKWYPTDFWVDQARKHAKPAGQWDGIVPSIEAVQKAEADPFLGSKAAWRVACRLADLGHYDGDVLSVYEQAYPRRAVVKFQRAQGWDGSGAYGRKTHERLFDL